MELWKSLRELTETVDASLPETENAPTVRHRTSGGRFTAYASYHEGGRPYLGSATVELGPDETKPDPSAWSQALDEARTVRDSWYPLELSAAPLPGSRTSTFDKQDLAQWVEPVAELVQQALRDEAVLPVREHLRFSKQLVQYRDAWGRELEETRYTGSLEVMLVPAHSPESHPFSAELRFSEFAPDVLAGFVRDQARLTRSAHEVRPWSPQGEFQVLIRGAALASIFDHLLDQLGGPHLAAGTSSLRLQKPLWDHALEPLTITALADLYNSPRPGAFDDEGVVLEPRTLVRDGIVRSFWTTQATAHWFGLPLTGRPRNFSVSPGTVSWGSLAGERVLDVRRLRWAELDPATGDFSAEVGLADLHEGRDSLPVFGFQVGGNLGEILTNSRFSSDVGSWEHYEGPEFLVAPSHLFRSL